MPDLSIFPADSSPREKHLRDHRSISLALFRTQKYETRNFVPVDPSKRRARNVGPFRMGIGPRMRKTGSVGGPVPLSLSSAVADISRAVPREELRVLVPRRGAERERERGTRGFYYGAPSPINRSLW